LDGSLKLEKNFIDLVDYGENFGIDLMNFKDTVFNDSLNVKRKTSNY